MNSDTWTSPTSHPAISREEVHVWRTPLDSPETIVGCLRKLLSSEELLRADRSIQSLNRARFIVGRGWLRTILGRYLGQSPDSIEFCYGKHGKPDLAESNFAANSHTARGLRFNLSHSQNLAVLAVASDRQVGIDVEQIRPLTEMDGIVRQHFSAAERDELYRLPVSLRLPAFFRNWTRKEAYLKALGEGLSALLDQVDVAGQSPRMHVDGRLQEQSRWTLLDIPFDPDYFCSICVEGSDWRLCCFQFEPVEQGWYTRR